MSTSTPTVITLGSMVTLTTSVLSQDPVTGVRTPVTDVADDLTLKLLDPDGTEWTFTSGTGPAVTYSGGGGVYYLQFLPNKPGIWYWRWEGDPAAQGAVEGDFQVESIYRAPATPPDLTDLRVLVPRARRYCEGPYGPPKNRPPLDDEQIYAMVADACGDIIMAAGNLFGHRLIVKSRDPRIGFPISWKTDAVLDEWEGAVIVSQTALNYFYFVFRELKTSEATKNEGTEWTYSLSANVIRDYIANLKSQRDLALAGLMKHHPVLDRFASTIRVRDQATVAMLEWWDTVSPGVGGGVGMPGGQEAAVIPWTPGWSGAGVSP